MRGIPDCNAAQIGTVVTISSGKPLADHWLEPIGDELITYMRNSEHLSIRALAAQTAFLARMLNRN